MWDAFAAALIFATTSPATAELPGVRFDVGRAEGAEGCPDAGELARALRERRAQTGGQRTEPLYISIQMELRGDAFVANVQVSGRKRGIRSLSGAGPSCDALRETLIVSLLVLVDEEPDAPASRGAPAAAAPAPRSDDASSPTTASVWLSVAGALTHGLPYGFSGAPFADIALRFPRWEASAGGFFAAEREVGFDPGRVFVSAVGGRGRVCVSEPLSDSLRLSGCGLVALAMLAARAEGFSRIDPPGGVRRSWWLLGVGPELRYFASDRVAVGLSGALLASAAGHNLNVEGLSNNPAYATDPVVGWLAIDVGVRIW